jgi:hydrogenase-4 component F
VLVALLAGPFLAAAVAYLLPRDGQRNALLVAYPLAHLIAVLACWTWPPAPLGGEVLILDDLGRLFLTVTAVLYALVGLYTPSYLALKGTPSNRIFVPCVLALLGAMDLVTATRHFGVLWVAVEASTLASAPLIAHRVTPAKLEATWKYLLLCSVGIALALLGTFFLGISASGIEGAPVDFTVTALAAAAPVLSLRWLKGSFVLLLVGYGTKLGLAPMHSWLPDAYSEAPSPVSALFSGALSSCAFLGILRVLPVLDAAGLGPWGRNLLILLGLVSLAVAAAFTLGQADLKRMLSYSSIENMGILALGVGLGGLGTYGALLHAVNHALAKALLFLSAGNVLLFCGTRSVGALKGLGRRAPWTGALFTVGFLAIVGSPPFGLFLSEFTILRAALEQGRPVVAALYLVLLAAVFVGMAGVMLNVLQGHPEEGTPVAHEPPALIWPPAVLALGVLVLGVVIPAPLESLLQGAARSLGG